MSRPKPKDDGKEKDRWLEFRYCKDRCFRDDCRQCGYFWGPDHPLAGQPVTFGIYKPRPHV